MIQYPIIIDDVIPSLYQDEIERFLLEKQPWFFQSDITFSDAHLKELDKMGLYPERRAGFGSMIFDPGKHFGTHNNILTPILYSAIEQTGHRLNQILLIRGFMSIPVSPEKPDRIDKPHVDRTHDHTVCLYYVNDADGDTVIFNKLANYEFEDPLTKEMSPNDLPVLQTVTPKKGRCIVFDGRFYHASTQPTTGIRCVINFNFV